MEQGAGTAPAPDPGQEKTVTGKAGKPGTLPGLIQKALEQIPDPDAKTTLQLALSRTTTLGLGPDPETAKILAETEKHEENCRLDAYRASLANRDKQSERDHDFRKRRLNREFAMNLCVLLLGFSGAAVGLYFVYTGNTLVGSNVLIASIGVILYVLKGSSELMKP